MRGSDENLILHVDVDAFFASVEQLLIPSLRKRPVIVGSGCIASCSYEARRFGLHAGMPLHEARRRCDGVVVLAGQQPIYRCFAEQIWQICRTCTCGLETFLDEAYGDATGIALPPGGPEELGRRLRRQVRAETGLSVTVGMGPNRMIAKVATRLAKPAGVKWISAGEARAILSPLPIESLPGVGPKTVGRLRDLNVATVGDLAVLSREVLRSMFGRRGEALHERCRGRDVRTLCLNGPDGSESQPKTISRETTFHRPTCDRATVRGMLAYLLQRAMRTARQLGLLAGAVQLTLRYDDWKQSDARRTLDAATADDEEALAVVTGLFERLYVRRVALRHVGVVLSKFARQGNQRSLFEPGPVARRRDLTQAMDNIRDRWGHGALVTGESIELIGKLPRNDYGFVLRTPSLTK